LWINHDLELSQDDLLPARQASAPEVPPCM
jgi:hypothetical protein